MKNFPRVLVLLMVLLGSLTASACSTLGFGSSKTTGVMQIGKDSYTVRAISARSTSEAKQAALVSANAYCKEQGSKNVMLVREFGGLENETNEKFYDLTFMCLQQNDKDFARIRKAADLSATDGPSSGQFIEQNQ